VERAGSRHARRPRRACVEFGCGARRWSTRKPAAAGVCGVVVWSVPEVDTQAGVKVRQPARADSRRPARTAAPQPTRATAAGRWTVEPAVGASCGSQGPISGTRRRTDDPGRPEISRTKYRQPLCPWRTVVKLACARSYRPLPPWQAIGARAYLSPCRRPSTKPRQPGSAALRPAPTPRQGEDRDQSRAARPRRRAQAGAGPPRRQAGADRHDRKQARTATTASRPDRHDRKQARTATTASRPYRHDRKQGAGPPRPGTATRRRPPKATPPHRLDPATPQPHP
jgi:hypothetical protein